MFLTMLLAIKGAQGMLDLGQSCRGVEGGIEGQMHSPGARVEGSRQLLELPGSSQEANPQSEDSDRDWGLAEEEKPQPLPTLLASSDLQRLLCTCVWTNPQHGPMVEARRL